MKLVPFGDLGLPHRGARLHVHDRASFAAGTDAIVAGTQHGLAANRSSSRHGSMTARGDSRSPCYRRPLTSQFSKLFQPDST